MSEMPESETIIVEIRRDDATVLVLGPLDAAVQRQEGSVLRLRETIARKLDEESGC